ncbi:hypothetical protein WJX73_002450 [Symbiochloris irregularis]|uniref:Septin-type G domain-containing protein n=1 Tax=Symbiochloris irregularis TaxID=706552 RepID=A0AAW1NT19_9CHLO
MTATPESVPTLANGIHKDDGSSKSYSYGTRSGLDGSGNQGSGIGRTPASRAQHVLRIPAKHSTAHVNLLLAGGAGLGKTTFIKQFFHEFVPEGFVAHDGTPTGIEKFRREGGAASLCSHLPEPISTESGEYKIHYHIQDTPGSTNMNSAEVKDLVIKHVQSEKEAHFRMRLKDDAQTSAGEANKDGRSDRLIDLCLYFIPPQQFTQQDIDFITELSKEVLVIPVCAKSDAMTVDERAAFHKQVKDRLASEGITYGFIEEELGEAARAIGVTTHAEPLAGPPFVVVASNTYKQIGSEVKPVRSYPWGDCVVTDPKHSDFALIQEFVTTAAFHKLRRAKKRQFDRYCRTRIGSSATEPRTPTKLDSSNSTEDMAAELRKVKAQLESERQRAAELDMDKMSVASSIPRPDLLSSSITTPDKNMRSKSGLFGRAKQSA